MTTALPECPQEAPYPELDTDRLARELNVADTEPRARLVARLRSRTIYKLCNSRDAMALNDASLYTLLLECASRLNRVERTVNP
jgi:hypothetical protein